MVMSMSILGALKLAPCSPAPTQQPGRASSLHFNLANAGAAALVAASLLLADPALAFRGGGPYGQQVTRGQDLTGKDFSGQTLIKQDFKTSILQQTNFKGANLLGASFFDADLTGADLSDADLRNADFSLANVTKILPTFHSEMISGITSAKLLTGEEETNVDMQEHGKYNYRKCHKVDSLLQIMTSVAQPANT